jgi:nucleoside-diphosphate kinase
MLQAKIEQTLVLIKPDALKNSLTGYVFSLLSEFHTGLHFAGAKIVKVNKIMAEAHYAEHKGKIFYPALMEAIRGRIHYKNEPGKQRVIAIVYQGPNAVKQVREIAGPTNPHDARNQNPGCIRSLGTAVPLRDDEGNIIGQRMDNLIHASANLADAEREIKLWFKPNEIPPSMRIYPTSKSEVHYYYKDNKLYDTFEQGSICILAPGDLVWKSDLEVLNLLHQGKKTLYVLELVVAKYLINEEHKTVV